MPERRTYISGGHVYCQLHRDDRDVAQCVGCERLRRLSDTSSPPFLLCEVQDASAAGAEDPLFMQWWYQHHRRGR